MEIVHERAAASDVSKKDAKVGLRLPGWRKGAFTSEVATWGATTNQVLALREYLLAAQVSVTVMEATGKWLFPVQTDRRSPSSLRARSIPGRQRVLRRFGDGGLLRPPGGQGLAGGEVRSRPAQPPGHGVPAGRLLGYQHPQHVGRGLAHVRQAHPAQQLVEFAR